MIPRRLAVLHDSPEFGGHERAFLTWLPAVLAAPQIDQVHILTPARNRAFLEALATIDHPKLHVEESAYVKLGSEPLRAPFRWRFGRACRAFIRRRQADLVLMLQGRIENLATPMLWAPRNVDMVSYVPMAHSTREMGKAPLPAAVADAIKRVYYRRPRRFITPSHAVAAQLRRAGAAGPVHVVENVPPPGKARDRADARSSLDLPIDRRIALFMGRFDTHQKGLDLLLRDLTREAPRLREWCFVFVGRGPGEGAIRAALLDHGLDGRVVDWTSDPGAYLAAADVLLAPSRFEGVPLVMLEALQQGVPILASDIDVFREYLAPEALYDFNRPVDLVAALNALTGEPARLAYARHAEPILQRLDCATSQKAFVAALLGEPHRAAP